MTTLDAYVTLAELTTYFSGDEIGPVNGPDPEKTISLQNTDKPAKSCKYFFIF
jgi:hypothetical protein